jgi:competence protein ComEC
VRCPAAIPAIALCAGIAAGVVFSPPYSPFVPLCIFLCAVASFWLRRERTTVILIFSGFLVAGIALGRGADSAARHQPLREVFDRQLGAGDLQLFTHVEGRLRADVLKEPSGATLDVLIDRIEIDGSMAPTRGRALVGVGGALESDRILQWRAGRRVAFPAALRRPTQYFNPGVGDAERQLAWRGIALVGSVKSDRLIDVTGTGTPLMEAVASVRAAIRRSVGSSVAPWSTRSAAVVSAILIGDRAGLDDDVERRLQEAGTYHVIAISGGNIAILAGLSLCVLRLCRFGPRGSALLVIVILGAFACVAEGGSSVGRATLMATIYFTAQLGDHRTLPINVAALAAAMLFCVDPLQVVDTGFALTFGATLGILLGMSKLAGVFPESRWLRAPAALLMASVCAEIALLPIGAFAFSRVTVAGLIVNFAAIPLMTLAQIAGMAAVGLSGLSADLARWTGWMAHIAVEGLIGSAALVDVFPWLTRRLAPPSPWVMAVYYGSLVAILYARVVVRLATITFVLSGADASTEIDSTATRDVSRRRPG